MIEQSRGSRQDEADADDSAAARVDSGPTEHRDVTGFPPAPDSAGDGVAGQGRSDAAAVRVDSGAIESGSVHRDVTGFPPSPDSTGGESGQSGAVSEQGKGGPVFGGSRPGGAQRRQSGTAGKPLRRFAFTVDREHARAVNAVVADTRRLRFLAFVATIVLGLVTAWLIWLGHPYSFLLAVAFALGTVTSLFVALWTPHRARIEKLYAEGELVPAIVSDQRRRGALLLALVNIAKSGADPRYALITRTVRALPGHSCSPGEQIPSVTVRADRAPFSVGGLRQSVGAMPIAWGTRDPEVIERARDAIPEAEWKLLADNRTLAEKVRTADAKYLLLDPHQLPEALRG